MACDYHKRELTGERERATRPVHSMVLLLLMAALALRVPSFEEPFDYNAGARAYGALRVLEGDPYYTTYHPGHHVPGADYLYAIAFRLFGTSYFSVKVLYALLIVLEVALLYALGRRLGGPHLGLFAAYLFALFTSDPFLMGTSGQRELPANLPRIAGALFLWLALGYPSGIRRTWLLVAHGAAAGASFWFKPSYLVDLSMTGVFLCVQSWQRTKDLRQMARALWQDGVAISGGLLGVVLPAIAYLAAQGSLPGFVQVFSMGASYIAGRSDTRSMLLGVLVVPVAKLLIELWLLVSLAVYAAWSWIRSRPIACRASGFILVWIVVSFVTANVSLYPYRYYDLLVIPGLALAAGAGLAHLRQVRPVWVNAAGAALIVVAAPLSIYLRRYQAYSGRAYYDSFLAYRLGLIERSEYLLRAIGSDGYMALQTEAVGDYVRERTQPGDRVYVWPNQLNFYFVSRRESPIRYLWPSLIGSWNGLGPPEPVPEGWETLQRKVLDSPAVYIAVFEPGTEPAWLHSGLAERYALERTLMGVDIYRWVVPLGNGANAGAASLAGARTGVRQ